MLEIINVVAISIGFNLLFFLYASTKMETKLNPMVTTLFSFVFSVPLSILMAGVYTIMMIYAVLIGANEDAMWAYLEEREVTE
ncbi:hypothetical protein [Adhaeribacter radiodurans]|uniref:Uncharacterized protein n=1 Tax=Adhaeribacter radiodurans TaxID=2745197 RepID=A0A7L7L802_9BACT|nr:hypothetical protein [Adhaeribacter radiodurans]QMU28918.1 hypothetical protein HUW48_13105 [Adhaeribacter radiodurans]